MRRGLIAVGAAIAMIGAGVIVAVTLPVAAPHDTQTGSVTVPQLEPGLASWVPLNVTAADRGSVSFSWTSTQRADVRWYAAVSCSEGPNWCVEGLPLQTWHDQTSGVWNWSGPVYAIYSVQVNDTTSIPLNFTGEFHEEIPDSDALLPMLPMAVSVAGGALLIGMGGLATYLGLFLPSGVYSSSLDEGMGSYAEDEAVPVEEPPHGHFSRPPPP